MRKSLNTDFLSPQELAEFGVLHAEERNILVHRTCVILDFDSITFGQNVRIDPFSVITCRSLLLGDYIHISSGCALTGRCEITLGDFSGLSDGVLIYTSSDDYSGKALTNPTVPPRFTDVHSEDVHIGRHAILGARTTVLPGAKIEDGASTGVNTLVSGHLAAWTVYVGVPARVLKPRLKDCLAKETELRLDESKTI